MKVIFLVILVKCHRQKTTNDLPVLETTLVATMKPVTMKVKKEAVLMIITEEKKMYHSLVTN
jgi:hypothetical protein